MRCDRREGKVTLNDLWTAEHWNERYASSDRIWSGEPNPQLVTETTHLEPGSALDVGCGEGADAQWLARRGWRVTAADVSSVALERAAAHTDPEIADRISWLQADLITWIPDDCYDLVSAQFMHLPRTLREPAFARLAAAVALGGTLLIVGHDIADLDSRAHRFGEPDMFFAAEDVAATLDPARWLIQTQISRSRGTSGHDGEAITIHDTVLRATRRDAARSR